MKICEIIKVLEKSKIFYTELVKYNKENVGMCFPIAHTLGNILNERIYYNDIYIFQNLIKNFSQEKVNYEHIGGH